MFNTHELGKKINEAKKKFAGSIIPKPHKVFYSIHELRGGYTPTQKDIDLLVSFVEWSSGCHGCVEGKDGKLVIIV